MTPALPAPTVAPAPAPGALGAVAPALAQLLAARRHVFTLHPASPRTGAFRARFSAGQGDAKPATPNDFANSRSDWAETPVLAGGAPDVSGGDEAPALAAALAAARADAFAVGLEEGARQYEAALGTRLCELDRLVDALTAARAIDADTLAPALAATVNALLAEVLGADPGLETNGLEDRARAALAQLADEHAPATLWLAPAQAAALGSRLARPALDVFPDPTLGPGALRLAAGSARLDDSPAARLARLAPALTEVAANDMAASPNDYRLREKTEAAA